jgi:Flp pilus assembly pilin Flp
MLEQLRRVNRLTRIQYGLMLTFGALCILTAFAPLEETIRITIVGTLFGFTAGLWVSHLVQVLGRAARANRAEVTVGD